jgi:hypothetical protein
MDIIFSPVVTKEQRLRMSMIKYQEKSLELGEHEVTEKTMSQCVVFARYYYGDHLKEDEMGGA